VILDPGQPLFTFAGISGATTVWPAGGQKFDVSSWGSWSLFGTIFTYPPGVPSVTLIYPSLFVDDDQFTFQNIFLPTSTQLGAGTPFMVAGRLLGPLLSVDLVNAINGNFQLDFFVNNRTRLYDQPYTPSPLGTFLASIPNASLGAAASTTVTVPYYMGPARLSLHASAGAARGRVIDNLNNIPGNVNAGEPTSDFWLPGLISGASTGYSLTAINDAAGASNIAAALVAA